MRQGFFKDKAKLLIVSGNFWKLTISKAFDPKFSSTDRKRLVLIQNFVLKTNIFNLFWNRSRKTKAFDLKRALVWHCYLWPTNANLLFAVHRCDVVVRKSSSLPIFFASEAPAPFPVTKKIDYRVQIQNIC